VETLLRELEATDPLTFSRIDPRNPRRVVRAVEVLRLTGRPFSDQRSDWSAWAAAPSPWVGLRRAPQDLKRRIETRVDLMFERGLIEETRELLAQGLESNRAAMQAIGYRQVAEHLRGVRTREQTIELVKARTRQFARRQATWFRHQLRVAWLDVAPDEPPKTTAERLLARHRGGG
jgi:tRNA dimethylallyltransferase